jgi:hypothetical protein
MTPTVGRIVHYVSYGTPGGEYKSECRAAIITWVHPDTVEAADQLVSLCVLNPSGMFFNETVAYHDGAGEPGNPDCPNAPHENGPFRYCACGWTEPQYKGGTWHWPERAQESAGR